MSLKRYAIIAAASYHKSHQQNDTKGTTTTPTAAVTQTTEAATESTTESTTNLLSKTISTATTSSVSSSLLSLLPSLATESQSSKAATATTTSFPSYFAAYGDDDDNDNDGDNNGGSSVPPAFYGDLRPFHQQNIRSGHGINGNSGVSYPNAINGNVNLLLGGAMLSLVTTVLCVVCYCCHRSIKKRTEAAYRQQRQWMESDPNMEVYSVEQCYETSGLFVAESNDGVATLPTNLRHEPPPSYDAVILMQEQQLLYHQQQQQQQLLQQQQTEGTSPPPGYRSSLDVPLMVAAATSATIPTSTFYIAAEPTYNNDNHNNNNYDTDINNSVRPVRRCDLSKAISNSSTAANQLFNMKRVWSAQSCCSLQRAEVESMWNAAAAAVAARATRADHVAEQQQPQQQHHHQQQSTVASIMARKISPSTAATARTLAPSTRAASTSTSVERFGQHYLKESFYRHGCPLCGKCRYDAASGTMPISSESCLELSTEMNGNSRRVVQEEVQQEEGSRGTSNHHTHHKIIGATATDDGANECSCSAAVNYVDGLHTIDDDGDGDRDNNKKNVGDDSDDDDENGNLAAYVGNGDIFECYAVSPELDGFYQAADEVDKAHVSKKRCRGDNNANATPSPPPAADVARASGESIELTELDSINDNGIVRLDMSKIIDDSGLPTYEAALKLDSSGYV